MIIIHEQCDKYTCRLHTKEEVQVSTRFTLLRAAGPRWWKKRRDRTKVCNRLVLWATWPWQCIHGLATTASATKGSSADIATVQTIAAERYTNIQWKQFALFTDRICTVGYLYSTWTWLSIESDAGYQWLLADTIFCPVPTSSLKFRTTVLSSLCRIVWPNSCYVDFNSKKPAALSTAESAFNRSTHN